jgi:hypothetical protein
MVAHVMGRPDNLSGDFRAMRRGLDFLLAQDRADAYPEGPTGPPLKDGVLAKSVAHTVLQAFAAGEIASAYGLLLLHGRILRRGRNWHWLLRLPMLPLLAALKPSSFVVRRRARQGASGH